jgi:hypothetical protein
LLPSTRDFDKRIRDGIKEAVKSGKAPIGKNLLKVMNKELYLKQVQEFVNQAH